jgi:hypothetical protein
MDEAPKPAPVEETEPATKETKSKNSRPLLSPLNAHVIALFILFCLWRFPSASVKSQSNDPTPTKGRFRSMTTDSTSDDESTSDEESVKISDLMDEMIGTDEDEWNKAAAIAMVSCQEDVTSVKLPRLARVYSVDGSAVRDRDGRRILHVMPGQMDPSLAKPSTYALALALYIDRKMDRASSECLTVALDVRGGKGWRNIPPLRNLPFIKTVVKLLLAMFPERLHKCLLFPVPQAAS